MSERRTPVRPQRIRRAERPDLKEAARTWRTRIGWGTAVLGLALFLTGSFGARLGIVILPFDPHHVIGQFGGAVFALIGVGVATRDS